MSNKIRNFLNLSLAVLFFFVCSFVSAQENVTALAKKITPSIVSVTTYDGQGKALSQGNGFFINAQGDVITGLHVLRNARRAEIKTSEGTVCPVKVVLAVDKKVNLVLLSVNLPQQKAAPLSLSSSIPKAGEKIAVVFQKGVSEGSVSAIEDLPGAGKLLPITAPLAPGLAGSPVVTMRGEVIGIAFLQTIQGKNRAVVIPGAQITNLASQKPAAASPAGQGKPPVIVSPGEDPFVSGMKFFQAARFEQALPYFEKAAKQNPKKSEAYFYIGLCYSNRGRNNEAIVAYKQAITLKPDYADAHINLGVMYASLGRYNEAIDAYKQAIRLKPDNAPAYVNLGIAQGRVGRHNEAMESFRKAVSLKSDYAEAYRNLGSAYGNLGRPNEAIEAYKKAISLKPDYALAQYDLGVMFASLGRFNEAIEAYKQVLRLQPNVADCHNNLGLAYARLGRYNEAIEAFKKVISLKPDYYEAYNNLGAAQGKLDRPKEAIEAFKKAISLKSDYASAHLNLGIAYVSLGKKDSAQEEYKTLKTLNPKQADELLKEINQAK